MITPSRAEQMAASLKHRTPEFLVPSRPDSRLRMRQVLTMRFMHDMTLEQVGQLLGITRERVRQIETKAIRMIRANPLMRDKIRDTLAELDER
jgi:DNA-directed RNA polymerase sigma subunit (sigma70/sigma32)